jgi:hypothetical protein
MKLWKLCATAPLLAALSACTTTGESVPSFYDVLAETAGQNGRACIRHSDIRGYGVLDHDVISIDGRRNYYLATVMPGCNALDTSPSALFEERFSEVCGGGMHKVYAGGDHCTIRQMYEFENREAAFEAHRNAVERYDALREAAEQE